MNRRHKLVSILIVLAVMAATLTSVLRETHMSEQYGIARIRLARTTVYVKSRQCGAGCSGGLWLSRSADRCRPPNPAADYTLNFNQIVYARQDDTLVLLDDPRSLTRPTAGDWIDMRFLPPSGQAADGLHLQAIVFGEHLPTRAVPTQQVDFQPCVRAFGHNWNWL